MLFATGPQQMEGLHFYYTKKMLRYTKKMWTGCRKSREGPQRWSKDWEAASKRVYWETWVCSALRKKAGRIAMFWYLKDDSEEDGDSLLTRSDREKNRGNRYRLHVGRFWLDTRGKLFLVRAISHCNNLDREVSDGFPSAEHLARQGAGPSSLDHAFAKKG